MFARPRSRSSSYVPPVLLNALIAALTKHWSGLTVDALRHELLSGHGVRATAREIEAALKGNPEQFFGQEGGVWRLSSAVRAEELAGEPETDARTEPTPEVRPFVTDLPDLGAYVAFDLETTGLNPEHGARIIQISAVRMVGGRPSESVGADGTTLPAVFNEYVNLDGAELPYGLRLKLGFVDHPDWLEQLEHADGLATVLAGFREWLGDLPLVAHNARFDMAFLSAAAEDVGWTIDNVVVDSLELACLAKPELSSLRLEDLGQALEIQADTEAGEQIERWAAEQGVAAFSWDGFHNAVVDVLVLAAIVPRLLDGIRARCAANGALAGEVARLLPTLSQQVGIEPSVDGGDTADAVRGIPAVEAVPSGRQALVDWPYTTERVVDRFADALADKGLARRDSQIQMMRAVADAYQVERFLAVEAPTGTGKSLAYLIPSALWSRTQGETVVVATHTRALQDQLTGDLERVRGLLGLDVRGQVLKGIGNYICLDQAAAVYGQADIAQLTAEERFVWAYVLSWLSATQAGMLDEISYWARNVFPAVDRILDSLHADRDICSHETCAACKLCFHARARQAATQADIVVMNHALLLAKEWEHDSLRFERVVVDEAHNLEDGATNAATEEVSNRSVMYLVNRMLDRRSGQGVLIRLRDKIRVGDGQNLLAVALNKRDLIHTLVRDFGKRLNRYVELNQAEVDPKYGAKLALEADPQRANPVSWRPVQEAREQLVATLDEATSVLRNLIVWLIANPLAAYQQETLNEVTYIADKLAEQGELLDGILRVGYDRLKVVHWLEVERATPIEPGETTGEYQGDYAWAVKRAPVRVGAFLEERLYRDKRTLVFTSATLRTTRDLGFEFFLDRLGLKSHVGADWAIALPPELNYGRAMFAVARYMRADARPTEMQNFVDEVGQELGWFFRFTDGNGLTLFTARDRMLQVFGNVEPVLGKYSIPVGCQGETGSTRALLDEMRSRPGTVLLGLKSFWEGVDVPGPNLSYVVMEKLPFPMLFDPLIRARAAEVRSNSGREFTDFILPLMMISFKQGFGRLIRRESDCGAVILLDKRVWTKEYYLDLIQALPGMDAGLPEKAPVVVQDSATLLSRRAVYRAIAEHMQRYLGADEYAQWLTDWERLNAILELVPEQILTQLEQLLASLQVPDITPAELMQSIWDKVTRAIGELFHFPGFRDAEQEKVVAALLAGRDALVVLPTGSGKSFTFQLPALLRDGTTIVFSPLKALMKDQVDRLISNNLAVADRIDSSQTAEEQERVYQRMREGSTRLVYIAPERVRDPKLMAALHAAKKIVQVVVDEAHCVHMWGQSFRPDFLYISKLVGRIASDRGVRPPVAAFTATATPQVRKSIAEKLELLPGYAEVTRSPNRPELRFVVCNQTTLGQTIQSPRDKLRILVQILKTAERQNESAIVYVNTTKEAERLTKRLEAFGLNVRYYHGKMDEQARKDVQDMFLEGQFKTIIATKAFGMGIDKSDVRYVVHYQIPADLESYYQEAGRAGRDGKVSWCVLLYHKADLWIHKKIFIPQSLPDEERLGAVLGWLQRRLKGSDSQRIFIDPAHMAEDLGFEEERELGIHLHVLEDLRYIVRGVDVTLRAVVRLLCRADEFEGQARRVIPGNIAASVARLFAAAGVNEVVRTEIALVELALEHSMDPAELDSHLYTLALHGLILYRAFARAYTVAAGPRFKPGISVRLDTGDIGKIERELYGKLNQMVRYATSGTGDCLRGSILTYFGDRKPPTPPEECCSLCSPQMGVPWYDMPVEDLTDPARYMNVMYEVLKAVAWNASLDGMQGRNPYGYGTLGYLLIGDDYGATHHMTDEHKRARRQQQIASSPYYGVLNGLARGRDAVVEVLNELKDLGYIEDVEKVWDGGGYTYPQPTGRGFAQLESGRLFEV